MIPFSRCSKILGEAGKQEMLRKCSENSRSQIVFRTYIFRKLRLGAPEQYGVTQNYRKIEGKADRTVRDCTSIVKKVKEYMHKCK